MSETLFASSPATPAATAQPVADIFALDSAALDRLKRRLTAQFEAQTVPCQAIGDAFDHIQPGDGSGVALVEAMLALNTKHGLRLSLGQYVIFSSSKQGYWCNGYGWHINPMAASGYSRELPLAGFPEDARFTLCEYAAPIGADYGLFNDM